MRIGTRITLATTGLVITALVLYGVVTVRIRHAELRADVEKQTQLVGNGLQISLEAALQEGLYEDVRKLVRRIQAAEKPIGIVYVELRPPAEAAPAPVDAEGLEGGGGGGARSPAPDGGVAQLAEPSDEEKYEVPPPDAERDARIRRILIDGIPRGEREAGDRRWTYAYTLPIRDDQGRVVAVVDLTRDEGDVMRALAATQQNVAITVILLGAGLALLVWLSIQRAISQPLQRLVEGIDEVSHGDLTRAILRESEDEIGDLADRFNQMTANLREARVETERGVEARLALEGKLRHAEKLATIGQLAATIAHEVGTPLGVIGGRARTMAKKAADPQEVAKNANIIAAQTTRITKIIERLLDYARKKVTARARVDLSLVVRESVDFLEHQLAAGNVSVRIAPFSQDSSEGAGASAEVLADADELQQVTLNLLLNAMQSMPSGGLIEIALCGTTRRKPGLDQVPAGRYVRLDVSDEGVGIPADDRERIFEPFYSTKQEGGGTGLGLAVSQGIVKDHDGWIEIDAAARRGAVFRVYLPAAGAEARDAAGSTEGGEADEARGEPTPKPGSHGSDGEKLRPAGSTSDQ